VPKNLIELEERSVAHSDHLQSAVIKREGAHLMAKRGERCSGVTSWWDWPSG
jgi:hypothetical protein